MVKGVVCGWRINAVSCQNVPPHKTITLKKRLIRTLCGLSRYLNSMHWKSDPLLLSLKSTIIIDSPYQTLPEKGDKKERTNSGKRREVLCLRSAGTDDRSRKNGGPSLRKPVMPGGQAPVDDAEMVLSPYRVLRPRVGRALRGSSGQKCLG